MMIAPFVRAVLVSAAGIAATTGILVGIFSLFEKYLKPNDKQRSGKGTAAGEGTSRGEDHAILG